MGAVGTAVLDFGAEPGGTEATVAVTGQAGILSGSSVEAWIQGASTANNTEADHLVAAALLKVAPGIPTAGVGFTIYGDTLAGLAAGQFTVQWVWN